jgi:hypothetical protein
MVDVSDRINIVEIYINRTAYAHGLRRRFRQIFKKYLYM